MNKELVEEELDRELVHHGSKPGQPYMWSAHKVKISKKSLVIFSGNKEWIFQKRNFMGDGLSINLRWDEIKYEQCSLGHRHEKSKEEKQYEHMTIQWDHVDQLIEWIQLGSWTEIRGGSFKRVPTQFLTEIEELLVRTAEFDPLYKERAKHLLKKVRSLSK